MPAAYIDRLTVLLGFQDKLTRPLRRVQQNVRRASMRMKNSLEKVQGGLVGVVARSYGLDRLLAPSLAFESALSRIAPQAGGGAVALDSLRASAMRLNATYGIGANAMVEHLDAARRLTRLSGADLEDATKAALLFERQFKTGTREVFAAQAQLQGDWGIGITQANDALAHLLSQGGDKRGELLGSLLKYSVQFKSLGFDIQSTIGVTQQALQNGWSVENALDAVKEGGLRLRELGGAQTKALERLGLNGLANALRTGEVGVVQAMQRIGKRAEKRGNSDKFQVFSALFGAPAKEIGVESFTKLLQSVGTTPKIRGTFDKLYQHWGKGTDALLSNLRGKFQNTGVALGGNLLEVLTPLLTTTSKWLGEINKFIIAAPKLTSLIALLTAAFFGLVVFGGTMQIIIGTLTLAWAFFVSLGLLPSLIYATALQVRFLALKAAALVMAAAQWALNAAYLASAIGLLRNIIASAALKGIWLALKAATLVMAAAQWALNAAYLASPIFWVVAAIAALIAAVVSLVVYWDDLKAGMVAVWDVMKKWGQWLTGKFFALLDKVKGILSFIGDIGSATTAQTSQSQSPVSNRAKRPLPTLNPRPMAEPNTPIAKRMANFMGKSAVNHTNITIHAASAEDMHAALNRAGLAQ